MEASKINRRRFLKYVGAGTVVVGVASAYVLLARPGMQLPNANLTTTSATATSITYVQETTTTTVANPVEAYARSLGITEDIIEQISCLGEDGLDSKDEVFVNYLSDIQHFDFSGHQKQYSSPEGERRRMQENLVNTVLVDRVISDTESDALTYLHGHPTSMQPKVAKYDLHETTLEFIARGAAQGADPELVCELSRLPDIRHDKELYTEFFDNLIDISADEKNAQGLQRALDVGLKYGRRFCTPLQCLYWIWLDGKDIEALLRAFSTSRLATEAWRRTSTSRNYTSDRWKSFGEVTDRLSSGFLTSTYEQHNFKYVYVARQGSASRIFSKRQGNCADFAAFDWLCLCKNGYDSRVYTLYYKWLSGGNYVGHDVNVYRENGKDFVSSNGTRREYKDLETVLAQIAREQGYRLLDWADTTYRLLEYQDCHGRI